VKRMIDLSKDVEDALAERKPIVALESTIISHGMPHPHNSDTALSLEDIVRSVGAVPMTVGIVAGRIKCGLSPEEIRFFATSGSVLKANERDIPVVTTLGSNAATTVGASLAVASRIGVSVLVTGGIGGVSPDAGKTFDISADLLAITQYNCVTVCSGTKAFMDVGATLEYCETHRVPVASYKHNQFPYFYSRDSGHTTDWVAKDVNEIADVFAAKQDMNLDGGILVGVPLPAESALSGEVTRAAIKKALARVAKEQITGKSVTPALLKVIGEETKGQSLTANIALIKNNANVGARLSVALAQNYE